MKMQTQRSDLWTWCGRKGVGQVETAALKHVLLYVK